MHAHLHLCEQGIERLCLTLCRSIPSKVKSAVALRGCLHYPELREVLYKTCWVVLVVAAFLLLVSGIDQLCTRLGQAGPLLQAWLAQRGG